MFWVFLALQGRGYSGSCARTSQNAVKKLSEKGCERLSERVFNPCIGTRTGRSLPPGGHVLGIGGLFRQFQREVRNLASFGLPSGTVVATDSASVDADHDNGAALCGMRGSRRRDDRAHRGIEERDPRGGRASARSDPSPGFGNQRPSRLAILVV